MITPLNFKYDYNIEYRLSNIKYNFTSVSNLSVSYEQQTHIDFRNRTTRGVPETAAIRCRFVVSEGGARKKNDIERNQIKVVLATGIFEGTRDGVRNAARLKRRNKKANKKEKRLRKERKREREKCGNDWLVGCSRRSNFQNGSRSIKQVLLLLVQPKKPTNPSQNVPRIPPQTAGKIVSPSFFPCHELESRSTIPRIPKGLARLSSILRVCYYPSAPMTPAFGTRNPRIMLPSCYDFA